MRTSDQKTAIGCGVHLVFWIVALGIVAFLGTVSLEYAVETWADVLGNPAVDVPAHNPLIWLAGLLTAKVAVPVAIITYVLVVSGVLA